MDIKVCAVCKKEFDFDTSGFASPKEVVCSEDCAVKAGAARGRPVVIHDASDAVIAHNHAPGGSLKRPGH